MAQPIYSDDPHAIEKLKARLAGLEELQTRMRAINKLVRAKNRTALAAEPWNLDSIAVEKLFRPDFMGRIGYPDYELQNNNGNIHRIKERIAQLQAKEGGDGAA